MAKFDYRPVLDELRSAATNRYIYIGIGSLLLLGLALFIAINYFLMPNYTRQDVSVEVPRVINLPYEEAASILRRLDLRVEQEPQQFNSRVPRNYVVDQSPRPHSFVKPGRWVYLSVNSGISPTVKVPRVEGFSPREAANQLRAAGLVVADVRPDSIPHPYQNTVTRQHPPAGTTLNEGEAVTIWVSTGPGERWVTVPVVEGMTVDEAQDLLLQEYRLRSRVLGAPEDSYVGSMIVERQSNKGARVREGHEIRLHVDKE